MIKYLYDGAKLGEDKLILSIAGTKTTCLFDNSILQSKSVAFDKMDLVLGCLVIEECY